MEKNKRGQPRKASPGRAAPTPNKSTLPSQKRTKPTKNEATKVKTSTRKQKPSKPAAKSPVLSPMKTRSSPTKPTLKGKKAPDKKTTLSNKSTQNASNSKSAMKAKSPSTMPSGRKHTKKPARAIQSKLTLKRSPKHVKSASQKPLQVWKDYCTEQSKTETGSNPEHSEHPEYVHITSAGGELEARFWSKKCLVEVEGAGCERWETQTFPQLLQGVQEIQQVSSTVKSPVAESPSHKRPRLSLKAIRQNKLPVVQRLTPFFTSCNSPKEAAPAPSIKDNNNGSTENRLCVAALYNLGNTCFLNSVLQVLRHTPGFVDHIAELASEVRTTEKERKNLHDFEKEDSDDEEEDILTWTLVKNLEELFKKMNRTEHRFRKGMTDFLAIRPYELMSTIERLNPMFEGNLQHDAHELLRCLLAYVQDAVVELNKFRKTHVSKVSTNTPLMSLDDPQLNSLGVAANHRAPIKATTGNAKICATSPLKVKSENVLTPPGKEMFAVTSKQHLSSSAASSPMTPKQSNLSTMLATTADKVVTCYNDFLPNGAQTDTDGKKLCIRRLMSSPVKREDSGVTLKDLTTSCRSNLFLDNCHSKENRPFLANGLRGDLGASQVNLPQYDLIMKDTCIRSRKRTISGTELSRSDAGQRSRSSTGSISVWSQEGPIQKQRRGTSLDDGLVRKSQSLENDDNKKVCPKQQKGSLSLRKNAARRCGVTGHAIHRDLSKDGSGDGVQGSLVNGRSSHNDDSAGVSGLQKGSTAGNLDDSLQTTSKPLPEGARHTARKTLGLRRLVHSKDEENIERFFTKLAPVKVAQTGMYSKREVNRDLEDEPFSEMEKLLLNISDDDSSKQGAETEEKLKSDALHNVFLATIRLERMNFEKYLVPSVETLVKSTEPVEHVIENMFQGTMALRTRCLECENFTERKEEYQDVGVAVRKERKEEEDEDKKTPHAWILSALREVEHLRDDNKYFCDKCSHLVEAERSMHYSATPKVFTLHLKRFAAASGFFGGVTKINDHVATPLMLPCISDSCGGKCVNPTHRYELFAMVTHTGISISSGHYIAYVRIEDVTFRQESQMPDAKLQPENDVLLEVKPDLEETSLPVEEKTLAPVENGATKQCEKPSTLWRADAGLVCCLCQTHFQTPHHMKAHYNIHHCELAASINLDLPFKDGKVVDVKTLELSMHFPFIVHSEALECGLCTKKFTTWLKLCKHQELVHGKTHVTEKKTHVVCPVCGLSGYHNILRHILQMHPNANTAGMKVRPPQVPFSVINQSLKCGFCEKMFKAYQSLVSHLESEHGKPACECDDATCDLCGRCFQTLSSLLQHLILMHNTVPQQNVATEDLPADGAVINEISATEDQSLTSKQTEPMELSDPNNNADSNNNLDTIDQHPNLNLPQGRVACGNSAAWQQGQTPWKAPARPVEESGGWLECDDDEVTLLTSSQFVQLLSPSGSSTPYLLFYRRVTSD